MHDTPARVSMFGIGQLRNGEPLRETATESAQPGTSLAGITPVTQAAPIPPKLM